MRGVLSQIRLALARGASPESDDLTESLPLRIQVAYAAGQLGWAIPINLVGFWLIELYSGGFTGGESGAIVAGIALSIIAGGGRVFDAITDPLIAKLSDESSLDRGRRLPFMLVGAFPAGIFCVLLFSPLSTTASLLGTLWLAGVSILFYLFLTLYGTPYFALLPELSRSTEDRVNLATGIAFGWALGLVAAAQAPAIWNAIDGATAYSRVESIQLAVGILSGLAIVCMYVPVAVIDEREYADSTPSSREFTDTLRAFARNREFLSYVIADFSYFAGLMLITASLPFYTKVLLFPDDAAFAETLVGLLTLAVVFTWLLCYPIVNVLAKRLGKKLLIRAAFFSLGLVYCFITVLGLIPVPPLVQAFGVSVLSGIPMAVLAVLPNAVLGDIARIDAEETGDPQEGMFYAGRTFVQKLGQSVGLFALPLFLRFGKEPGNDIGVRLSGVFGALLCFGAFVAFRYYREGKVVDSLRTIESREEQSGDPASD
jgi:GPH family glycoside/pentoside/hexuronide:cation symporter